MILLERRMCDVEKNSFWFSVLTLSAVIFNFELGIGAGQSAEMVTKEAIPKISLVEALKIATEGVPGRVVEAELKDEDDLIFYEIEIISSEGMIVEVQVDAPFRDKSSSNQERARSPTSRWKRPYNPPQSFSVGMPLK